MRHIWFALLFVLGVFLAARLPAGATACTIPNTFTAGTPAVAAQVNANFTSLQSCANNVDHTNVGSAGIYASQIIPDSTAHATFGGSVNYVFTTEVLATTGSSVAAPMPPFYQAAGTAEANTAHLAWLTGTFSGTKITCAPFVNFYCAAVALTAPAPFTSATTFTCSLASVNEPDGYAHIDPNGADSIQIAWNSGASVVVATLDATLASNTFALVCFGT